jgi:hypothetical protein
MHFTEPQTDFRSQLFTDDGTGVDIDFNTFASTWQLKLAPGMSRAALRDMVRYLHDQFYRGEHDWLDDWLQLADAIKLDRPNVLTLKTVGSLVPRAEMEPRAPAQEPPTDDAAGNGAAAQARLARLDRPQLDADDPDEVRHWAQQFKTTEQDLKDAVALVGRSIVAVGDFVQCGRRPHHHPSRHRPPRLRDENLQRGGRRARSDAA